MQAALAIYAEAKPALGEAKGREPHTEITVTTERFFLLEHELPRIDHKFFTNNYMSNYMGNYMAARHPER